MKYELPKLKWHFTDGWAIFSLKIETVAFLTTFHTQHWRRKKSSSLLLDDLLYLIYKQAENKVSLPEN